VRKYRVPVVAGFTHVLPFDKAIFQVEMVEDGDIPYSCSSHLFTRFSVASALAKETD
jgi:hypothetical protein